MKITESKVLKLRISDLPNFDPIQVYLEDAGPGQGQITIVAYDGSYSRYWSHMGEQYTIESFFLKASTSYLCDKLRIGLEDAEDWPSLVKSVRGAIIRQRRLYDIDKEAARKWYDLAAELEDCTSYDSIHCNHELSELLCQTHGDDWPCHAIPTVKHIDERYLEKVIEFVKAALIQRKAST